MVSTKLRDIYKIDFSHASLLDFLKRHDLIRAKPATKRLLSKRNIKARKDWLVAYKDQNWDQVLFTDETSIEVVKPKPRLVTRPKGPRTKFRRACLHVEYPGDRYKVMFWAAVGKGYKSDLIWARSARHKYPGVMISWDKSRSGFNAESYAGIILGPLAERTDTRAARRVLSFPCSFPVVECSTRRCGTLGRSRQGKIFASGSKLSRKYPAY